MTKDFKKRKNCIIGIAALGLVLAACGAPAGKEEQEEWPEEHHNCGVQELSAYLYDHTSVSASPYASAEITIKDYEGERLKTDWEEPPAFQFAGEADVTWRFYNSLAEMEAVLNETALQETDENLLHFLYYTFPMTENDHALDLYYDLKSRFDTKKHPLAAGCEDKGKLFYYIQETREGPEGHESVYEYKRNSKVNLYVKDRTAYGLTLMNAPSEDDDETLEYVFKDVFQRYGYSWGSWVLNEENLYWIDHEERLTELENPKRSFREVRGIDENLEIDGEPGVKRYFGLLVEADYELPLTENGRMLSLHFSLAEEADTELRYFLLNGFCMNESYDMTVTDMETGETLQESSVSLSIELPDTITYPDLNGDGYADMRVGAPAHWIGEKAVEDAYTPPSYLLWDPQTEQFVRKTEKEVENSRLAVANGLTEEEKTKRERKDLFAPIQELPEGAEPEDYIKLTGDKMLEIFYIRKDPYSRGGLRSEGSFQIERPDGFAHYFLSGDVSYAPRKEENQIHSLPVTNPVGENPFHEPEDWETFQAEAIRCSEELCPGRVSNLTFEKSHMEDGCDLYGYYFEYDTGEEILEYVDFFKFGKDNMSEVIGVREQEPNTVLVNTVRYMAASFIDYGGERAI